MREFSLGEIADINPETLGVDTPKDFAFRYIDLGAVSQGTIDWAALQQQQYATSPSRARRRVQFGDCLFGTVRPLQRSHGFIDRTENEFVASTGFSVLRAKSGVVDARYLYHWMLGTSALRQSDNAAVGSNYPAVNESDVAKFKLLLPSFDEQRRIAEILDSVDDSIQTAVIAATKAEELRAALVRDSMREGLDLVASVEASRLASVRGATKGEWTAVPLGNLLHGIDAGRSPDLEDEPAGPGQWGVLKVSAVGRDKFRPRENKVVRDRTLYDESLCVRPGDLIMTRANTAELVGLSCIVEDTPNGLMLCDKTLRLKVAKRIAPAKFVNLVLGMWEVRRQIEIAATGTSGSMKNISQISIKRLTVPLAGIQKLDRILETEAACTEQLAARKAQVRHLQMLKRGLMDDLLTGRVRVSV